MPSKAAAVRPSAFFALTYVLSWLVWIPLLLSHRGIGPLHVAESTSSAVRLLGVLMPAVAGLILTALTFGRAGLGRLARRLVLWRVGWGWWGPVILVQPVLLVLTALVYNGLGGTPPVTTLPLVSVGAVVVNVVFLAIASLGEEIGWRGVALPALQRKHGPVVAGLILAVVFNIVNTAWLPVTATPGPIAALVVVEWGVGLWLLRHLEPADVKAARLKTMGAS